MAGTPHLVSDVMTRTVGAVRHRAAFKDVVRARRQWHVGAVPVVDDEGHVVGVLSEADLLHKEALRDGDPDLPRAGHTPRGGPPIRRSGVCRTSPRRPRWRRANS